MFHGYQLFGVIGSGTYGEVFKACKGRELNAAPWYEVSGPPFYAIKRQIVKEVKQQKKEGDDTSFSVSLLREVKLLRELKHPNIVNMCDLIIDSKSYELALVFEYAEYEMMKIIEFYKNEARESIPEYTLKSFLWQSLKGLKYLHENWVMHRDLKPENILIVGGEGSRRGSVVLADLGLARIFRNPIVPLGVVDKVVVTLWYRAPELLLGSINYTPAIDMWSMGCIFAALLLAKDHTIKALFQGRQIEKEEAPFGASESKRPPFQSDQCERIFRILGTPKSSWPGVEELPDYDRIKDKNFPKESILKRHMKGYYGSDTGFDLLSRMLALNPAQRITAADALKHPYFSSQHPLPGDNAIDIPSSLPNAFSRLKFPIEPPKPLSYEKVEAQNREIKQRRADVEARFIADQEQTKRQKLVTYGDL